jgi:tRNA threonylcarbamoyladenosine biosynthesis protein TsaB
LQATERRAEGLKETMPGEGLLILSADTATEKRSVAVIRGGRVLSLCVSGLRDAGAANALADVARALAEASVKLGEVELFAVTTGPGSFTGLRSGLATMKALAATLKKPVLGVPTLHAIAHGVRPAQRVAVMIPAGRGEVFAQILSVSSAGEIVEQGSPTHESPTDFVERVARLGGGVKWAGNGSIKFSEMISEHANASGLKFVTDSALELETDEPAADEWVLVLSAQALALDVGSLAKIKFENGAATGADELRALYVRQSDAEIKEQCRAQS